MGNAGTQVMATLGMFQDMKRKQTEYKHDKAVEEYTQNLMKDEKWTPDFEDPDTDARAFQAARLNMMDEQEKEMGLREKKYKMIAQAADAQQQEAIPLYKKATSLGTSDMALSAWEELGEKLMNNTDYVLDKENNTVTIKDQISGTEEPMKFESREEMVQWFQTTAGKLFDKDNFAQFVHTNYNENTMANQKIMMSGVKHRASDGTVGFVYEGIRDKFTGEIQPPKYEVVVPGQGMVEVTEEVWKKGAFQKEGEAKADLEREKTQAGIAKTRAETGKLKEEKKHVGKGKGTGQPHSDEKLADFYIRSGIAANAQEAHAIIQAEKARPEKFKAYAEQIAWLDPEDDGDRKKILQIRKELGLDKYFPKGKKGKGAGVAGKDAGSALQSKYPAAKHKGKTAKVNGVVYKSDGKSWIKQ